MTATIDLTQPLETIWRGIKPRRRRYINEAERKGIMVESNSHHFEWLMMQLTVAAMLGSGKGSEPLIRDESKGCLLVAVCHGEVLAGEFYQFFGDRIRAFLAASKHYVPEKRKLAALAHALVIWESIKYAKAAGFKVYDFGGMSAPDDPVLGPITRWKLSFGGKVVDG